MHYTECCSGATLRRKGLWSINVAKKLQFKKKKFCSFYSKLAKFCSNTCSKKNNDFSENKFKDI